MILMVDGVLGARCQWKDIQIPDCCMDASVLFVLTKEERQSKGKAVVNLIAVVL